MRENAGCCWPLCSVTRLGRAAAGWAGLGPGGQRSAATPRDKFYRESRMPDNAATGSPQRQ